MSKRGSVKKVVLAYSGGLDTSIILKWLQTEYGAEVVTFTADLGQGGELEPARKKAEQLGIKQIYVEDVREEFIRDFVFPMFRANALYEGVYLLGTSIARPLIAKRLIEIARETGADAIAHGATGKGKMTLTLTGSDLGKFEGHKPDNKITKATSEAGEKLFLQYGCSACHSTDGSKNHGPSVGLLFGHEVEIDGLDKPVKADRDYIIESIKAPNAKIVKGYPPNYMPPFGIPDVEYESLALYIESLANPE